MMNETVANKKTRPYRGERYWEKEKPVEVSTNRISLQYFPKAGKLQVSILWLDRETGEKRRGRTVTIDHEDISLYPEVRELLERVLKEWQ